MLLHLRQEDSRRQEENAELGEKEGLFASLPKTSLRKCFNFAKQGWHKGSEKNPITIKMLLLNNNGRRNHIKSIQPSPVFRRIKQTVPSTMGHNHIQSKHLNVKEKSFAGLVL